MAMQPCEECGEDFGGLYEYFEVVVGEDTRVITFRNAQQLCHSCQRSASIVPVKVRFCKLPKRSFEGGCWSEVRKWYSIVNQEWPYDHRR